MESSSFPSYVDGGMRLKYRKFRNKLKIVFKLQVTISYVLKVNCLIPMEGGRYISKFICKLSGPDFVMQFLLHTNRKFSLVIICTKVDIR